MKNLRHIDDPIQWGNENYKRKQKPHRSPHQSWNSEHRETLKLCYAWFAGREIWKLVNNLRRFWELPEETRSVSPKIPKQTLQKTLKGILYILAGYLYLECGYCMVNRSDSPEHRNDFFGVFLGDLFIFMDWSQTHYIFQKTFSMDRAFFPPFRIG